MAKERVKSPSPTVNSRIRRRGGCAHDDIVLQVCLPLVSKTFPSQLARILEERPRQRDILRTLDDGFFYSQNAHSTVGSSV